jgi:hypothetical protein
MTKEVCCIWFRFIRFVWCSSHSSHFVWCFSQSILTGKHKFSERFIIKLQSVSIVCNMKNQTRFDKNLESLVVYHLHGKPIRFEIVLMVSKISDRKSHSDYALSI